MDPALCMQLVSVLQTMAQAGVQQTATPRIGTGGPPPMYTAGSLVPARPDQGGHRTHVPAEPIPIDDEDSDEGGAEPTPTPAGYQSTASYGPPGRGVSAAALQARRSGPSPSVARPAALATAMRTKSKVAPQAPARPVGKTQRSTSAADNTDIKFGKKDIVSLDVGKPAERQIYCLPSSKLVREYHLENGVYEKLVDLLEENYLSMYLDVRRGDEATAIIESMSKEFESLDIDERPQDFGWAQRSTSGDRFLARGKVSDTNGIKLKKIFANADAAYIYPLVEYKDIRDVYTTFRLEQDYGEHADEARTAFSRGRTMSYTSLYGMDPPPMPASKSTARSRIKTEPKVKPEPEPVPVIPKIEISDGTTAPVTPPRKPMMRGSGSSDSPFTIEDSPKKRSTPRRPRRPARISLSPDSLFLRRTGGERQTSNSLGARMSTRGPSAESDLSSAPSSGTSETATQRAPVRRSGRVRRDKV